MGILRRPMSALENAARADGAPKKDAALGPFLKAPQPTSLPTHFAVATPWGAALANNP